MKTKHNLLPSVVILITTLMMSLIGSDIIKGIMFSVGCILYILYILNLPKPAEGRVDLSGPKLKKVKTIVKKYVKPTKLDKFFDSLTNRVVTSDVGMMLQSHRRKVSGITVIIAILGFFMFFTNSIWVEVVIWILGSVIWVLLLVYTYLSLRRLTQIADAARDCEVDIETMVHWINRYRII